MNYFRRSSISFATPLNGLSLLLTSTIRPVSVSRFVQLPVTGFLNWDLLSTDPLRNPSPVFFAMIFTPICKGPEGPAQTERKAYAARTRTHVVAWPFPSEHGGNVLLIANGIVFDGCVWHLYTPLTLHLSPVLPVVIYLFGGLSEACKIGGVWDTVENAVRVIQLGRFRILQTVQGKKECEGGFHL